jgi:thiol-disulfide isomerase/thioredoxin
MKKVLLVALGLFVTSLALGQKNKKFYDSFGNETTFELHWSQVVGGRYKSIYDRKTNSKTLVRTTDKEFKEELSKTEKRIIRKEKLGTDFPHFVMTDIDGNTIAKKGLIGKVTVINFWFVGCSPCEMERPELNGLATLYEDNASLMFISFARNDANQLRAFLPAHPFRFTPIPTDKDEIANRFGVNDYPVTIIVDKHGKYSLDSSGTGIGSSYILKREIEFALSK